MAPDVAQRLMRLYEELFAEEPGLSLERFLERVAAGEFGAFAAAEIAEFLRAVEAQILANIETMLEANPHLLPLRDQRVEETRAEIARLLERFAPGAGA